MNNTKQMPMIKELTWDINTNATTSGWVPLVHRDQVEPLVVFDELAYKLMNSVIANSPEEVSFFFLVEEVDELIFRLSDLKVPTQVVTSVETDVTDAAMSDLICEYDDEGLDTSGLYAWGHSHVNMQVQPSAQDEDQVSDFLDTQDRVIRLIGNKAGRLRIDLYLKRFGIAYTNVPYEVEGHSLTVAEETQLRKVLRDRVSKKVYPKHTIGTPIGGKPLTGVPVAVTPQVPQAADPDDGTMTRVYSKAEIAQMDDAEYFGLWQEGLIDIEGDFV